MRIAENIMTKRNIEFSKITNCKLHIAHVSTLEAMSDIIEAKRQGLK